MVDWRSTGNPTADAQSDFTRARRARARARLAQLLRGGPNDVSLILPFEEVVKALGRTGERSLGLKTIPLDSIVGTVDRAKDFDRDFRPTSGKVRTRWERLAEEARRGKSFPPIKVFRIGDLHFVDDGHHRVSVAKAQGHDKIDAYVTEVDTRLGADHDIRLSDLPLKGHERLFRERVPLPSEAVEELRPADPKIYGDLAEGVEAWGFRLSQESLEYTSREDVARLWYENEYRPAVELLREAGLMDPDERPVDAYLKLTCERYELLRTHAWDEGVVEELKKNR